MANRKISSHSRHGSRAHRAHDHHRELRFAAEERELEMRQHGPSRRRRSKPPGTPLWKRLRFAAVILLLIGLAQLGAALLTAPQFRVADVTVSGAEITSLEAVEAAQRQLTGQNWVRAQTRQIEKQLKTVPTVKTARITRAVHWPPHLHIHITERTPFARVGAGEQWWIVDESGMPFRHANASDENLYALTSPKFSPKAGEKLPGPDWQAAAQLIAALSTPQTEAAMKSASAESTPEERWSLRRIYLDKNGYASLRLIGGSHDELLVRLGGDLWPEKLQRARLAIKYFESTGQRASVLNLVSYSMPQWTPLRPAATENSPESDDEGTQAQAEA